jgi:hypothetical protein
MRDRWVSMQHRHDQISADLAKTADAMQRQRRGVDAVAMLAELAEGIDRIEAAQAAKDVRLAAQRRRGMAAYEKARAAFAGELAEDRSLTVAASLGIARPGVKVF